MIYVRKRMLTNDQGYHGGSVPSSSLKTLDQLLDFPYLDILLGLILLRGTHDDLMSFLLGKPCPIVVLLGGMRSNEAP